MINKFVSFVVLISLTTCVYADHPNKDVEKWLEKMHNAAHMINYEGTFVYGQNNELSSMQIIHSVDESGEFERLISLDGSGREVIRSGNTVTCVLPDKESVVVDKSRPDAEFPPSFPSKIDQLEEYYHFQINGEGRVAGQKTKNILIKPKDNYRYGHSLWIDATTGLLLKAHLLDKDGQMVEQFMFTQIDYPKVIEKERLQSQSKRKKFTWYEAKAETPKTKINQSMNWKVKSTPSGFVPGIQRHHKMTMSAMPVEHFMFSDGLSSISVFVEKQMEDSKNLMGSSTMGAVNAYGRAIGEYHVTVVGEVPHDAVKMIGDSVHHVKTQ